MNVHTCLVQAGFAASQDLAVEQVDQVLLREVLLGGLCHDRKSKHYLLQLVAGKLSLELHSLILTLHVCCRHLESLQGHIVEEKLREIKVQLGGLLCRGMGVSFGPALYNSRSFLSSAEEGTLLGLDFARQELRIGLSIVLQFGSSLFLTVQVVRGL